MGITRNAWRGWGIIVFVIPFQLYYNYVLNAFYHFGALSGDAGLFAHLLWHGDWVLSNPPYYVKQSFFCQHFSPFLLIFSQLSYFVPTHRVEYFAAFMGVIFASLGLALFYAFGCCIKPRNHWQMMGLAVVAIAFSFNGVVANGIDYIHFEYAIPLGIFLFLLSVARGQRRLGMFFFILTLSIREDAGFHLAAILLPLTLIRYFKHRSLNAIRWEAGFSALAIVYGLFVFWLTGHFADVYAHRTTMFTTVYAGYPAYAHLSGHLLFDRMGTIFQTRAYIWLPMLLSLLMALRTRDLYLAAGVVASLPWFLLNWTAHYDRAGTLDAYYAFPFTLNLVWPILAATWNGKTPIGKALALQIVCIGLSLVMWDTGQNRPEFGPTYGARWGSYRLQQGAENRELTRAFVMKFDAGAGELGNVMVDEHIFSLIAGQYQGKDIYNLLNIKTGNTPLPVNTLLYLNPPERSRSAELLYQVHKNNLSHHYCIAGAPLCMFTTLALPQLEPYSSLLMDVPVTK